MSELLLRPATPADAATIAEFNRCLAWESERVTLDAATLLAGVTAGLTDRHKGFYTVVERDGAIVGQTLVTFEWSDWRNGWFWWIQSVYVREDARRGGVFRALYRHIEQLAAADPTVIGLRLYVEAENERAKRTYRSLGMTDTNYGLLEIYPLPGRIAHAHHG
jgi:ribosomal protein S18 acetylase RimI-like enzyme